MGRAHDASHCLLTALERYEMAVDALVMLAASDTDGATNGARPGVYESLAAVRKQIVALADAPLLSLYERTLRDGDAPGTSDIAAAEADLVAHLARRLVGVADSLAIEVNEADIRLKESLGLPTITGVWGSRGWTPPGTYLGA